MSESLKKILNRAQIYKVEFKIQDKNYIYIGLDTKCDPQYFGSSLIIYHYQRVFGNEIFKKTILEDLTNISHNDLCSIEQRYIKESKKESREEEEGFKGHDGNFDTHQERV